MPPSQTKIPGKVHKLKTSRLASGLTAGSCSILLGAAPTWEAAATAYLGPSGPIWSSIFLVGTSFASLGWISLVTHREEQEREEKEKSDEPLTVLISTLHLIIEHINGLTDDNTKRAADFRLAVFIPSKTAPDKLCQITDYAGVPGKGGEKGRLVDLGPGVAGSAFKSRRPAFDSLPPGENFCDWMHTKHGFTVEQAARLTSDRKSWLAIPLGPPLTTGGDIFCVVYCDSRLPNFFGKCPKNGNIPQTACVKALIGASAGIAKLVLTDYKRLYSHL